VLRVAGSISGRVASNFRNLVRAFRELLTSLCMIASLKQVMKEGLRESPSVWAVRSSDPLSREIRPEVKRAF